MVSLGYLDKMITGRRISYCHLSIHTIIEHQMLWESAI